MSLNTAHAQGGVLIFNTERILIFYDGVEMGFEMDNSLPHFKGKKKGRAYLTTHRVIFNNKDQKDRLQSFSMPFQTMKEVELEQPVFGANYIKGKVNAEAGGNWEGSGKWKMWFNNGGAIDFGRAMLQAGKMASRYRVPKPPAYTPPTGNYYQAPPPAYTPPQGPIYGFVPYGTFPTAPPNDGVYMMDAPPPYPGIDPNLTPYPPPYAPAQAGYPAQPAQAPYPPAQGGYAAGYPPPQASAPYPPPQANGQPMDAAAAKAAEAAGSAYYNPANPHNVYMPEQYPQGAPPSYDAVTKKEQ